MENTTGPIKPFLAGKLPKKKYSDANEFAADLAAILAIEQERIVINLISLPDIKGEKGDKGDRGSVGPRGPDGPVGLTGDTGPAGPGLNFRGDWSGSGITYDPSDVVVSGGVYYVCFDSHTSGALTEPGTGADWTDHWQVLDATFIGQDGISFVWQGDWLTATTYDDNEVVRNNNGIYICILGHVSAGTNEPGVGVDTATYWELMVGPSALATSAFVTLTDAATVVWNADTSRARENASVTLTANRNLSLTGWASGMHGTLIIKQDGVGGHTITLPVSSIVNGGGAGAITLSAGAGAIDVLDVFYDGTNYFWSAKLNYT